MNDKPPGMEINPSNEQLTALNWRIVTGGTCYAAFALWTPINVRLVYIRKFATFRQTEIGTYKKAEVKGPGSFIPWRCCWRVFKTAAIMLGAVRPGTLDEYERLEVRARRRPEHPALCFLFLPDRSALRDDLRDAPLAPSRSSLASC